MNLAFRQNSSLHKAIAYFDFFFSLSFGRCDSRCDNILWIYVCKVTHTHTYKQTQIKYSAYGRYLRIISIVFNRTRDCAISFSMLISAVGAGCRHSSYTYNSIPNRLYWKHTDDRLLLCVCLCALIYLVNVSERAASDSIIDDETEYIHTQNTKKNK